MKSLTLVPIVLVAFAFAGCSNQTPLYPAAAPGGGGELSAKPSAATPGIYSLTFPSGKSPSKDLTWTTGS